MRLTAPTTFSCFCTIVLVRLGLRVLRFDRTWRMVNRLVANPGARQGLDLPLTLRHLGSAVSLFPGRARCLEQSLVLYYVLRRRGVPAELRLGVRPLGFVAHAWVELDGRAVGESAEKLRELVPLPQLPR